MVRGMEKGKNMESVAAGRVEKSFAFTSSVHTVRGFVSSVDLAMT